MKKSSTIVFVFFICWLSAKAQLESVLEHFQKKPTYIGSLTTRQTFIDGFKQPILGFKVGLDYEKIRLTTGFCYLGNSYNYKIPTSLNGMDQFIDYTLRFRYVNVQLEYVFYQTPKWEFSVPFLLGLGVYTKSTFDTNKNKYVKNRGPLFIYEPVIVGTYKIFDWLGVGGDIGYRFMLINKTKINSNIRFSSPVFAFRVLIFWNTVYKKVFPKDELKLGI